MASMHKTIAVMAAGVLTAATSYYLFVGGDAATDIRDGPQVIVVQGQGKSAPVEPDNIAAPQPSQASAEFSVLPALSAPVVEARRDRQLIAQLAPVESDEAQMMNGLMTAQPRDARVAAPLETGFQTAIGRIPAFASALEPVRVTCVATTCEVTGVVATNGAASLEQALRDPGLARTMLAKGYTPGSFTAADLGGGRTGFSLYLNNEM